MYMGGEVEKKRNLWKSLCRFPLQSKGSTAAGGDKRDGEKGKQKKKRTKKHSKVAWTIRREKKA